MLWLCAHSDFHTAQSSHSGNLHGTPLAYLTGRNGFPVLDNPIQEANVCMVGLRSVDPAEHAALVHSQIARHDMRDIDETGIAKPLVQFLTRVASAGETRHVSLDVSLDVDFLDPSVAPAVGTNVPGGADRTRSASGDGNAARQRIDDIA